MSDKPAQPAPEDRQITLERAQGRAAQAWCTPETSHITMDVDIAQAFAHILIDEWRGQSREVERLRAELAEQQEPTNILCTERDRYRAALEWYGNARHYCGSTIINDMAIDCTDIEADCGERARHALKEHNDE